METKTPGSYCICKHLNRSRIQLVSSVASYSVNKHIIIKPSLGFVCRIHALRTENCSSVEQRYAVHSGSID